MWQYRLSYVDRRGQRRELRFDAIEELTAAAKELDAAELQSAVLHDPDDRCMAGPVFAGLFFGGA